MFLYMSRMCQEGRIRVLRGPFDVMRLCTRDTACELPPSKFAVGCLKNEKDGRTWISAACEPSLGDWHHRTIFTARARIERNATVWPVKNLSTKANEIPNAPPDNDSTVLSYVSCAFCWAQHEMLTVFLELLFHDIGSIAVFGRIIPPTAGVQHLGGRFVAGPFPPRGSFPSARVSIPHTRQCLEADDVCHDRFERAAVTRTPSLSAIGSCGGDWPMRRSWLVLTLPAPSCPVRDALTRLGRRCRLVGWRSNRESEK